MPTASLSICRAFVERSYREWLGVAVMDDFTDDTRKHDPVWRLVTTSDLISRAKDGSEDAAGLLLDPQIGIMLYLIPFTSNNSSVRQQVVRALSLRAQLTRERNQSALSTGDNDLDGAWRITIHWLVASEEREAWLHQIMELRRETGFSEEIKFDAVFYAEGDLESGLRDHRLPQLLLATRQVLNRQRIDEVLQWLNADRLVVDALKTFTSQFASAKQRRYAAELVDGIGQSKGEPSGDISNLTAPTTPQQLRRLQVSNFRNLQAMSLNLGSGQQRAAVVHGPNGTGKSAVCEAISIALFGTSERYQSFAGQEEVDVATRTPASEYIKYLTPLHTNKGPQLAINDHAMAPLRLVAVEVGGHTDRIMSSTVLAQAMTQKFASMSANELGALVVRGYSDLADRLGEFAESRLTQANEKRQAFLAKLGVSRAITKIKTAYDRIARRIIDQSLPSFPSVLVSWLRQVSTVNRGPTPELAEAWYAWGEDSGRSGLARALANTGRVERSIQKVCASWLEEYNTLVTRTREFYKAIMSRLQDQTLAPRQVASWITSWGAWLNRDGVSTVTKEAGGPTELSAHRRSHDAIIEQGRKVRRRIDHLQQAKSFVDEDWLESHQDECPTCSADHSGPGGILPVIEQLLLQLSDERDRLAEAYRVSKAKLDQLQTQSAKLGRLECPLSLDQQEALSNWVRWLIPQEFTTESYIRDESKREALVAVITTLAESPSIPSAIDVESRSEAFSQQLIAAFDEAEDVFEAPNDWKPVKAKLDQVLNGIVQTHLPMTLAYLWSELSYNLTSAPWLLPARPQFAFETKKGQKQAKLMVKERVARYIFNEAEIHTFGVAWFLTRYLTYGRFYQSNLVMDDPAHGLDQTSFRDMCRVFETLVRLHRTTERPLSLVVMINQESRAMELARAIGATFTILSWSSEQDNSSLVMDITREGFYPLHPRALLPKFAS